jgi:N-acetyllactosaminide beta-1,3-N-acetylglucosaminyltransferase
LDNVVPLVKRWEAPLSVAVYAPGSDFNSTQKAIFHLRNCIDEKELVKDFVSFHIFFEKEFSDEIISGSYEEAEKALDCSENYLANLSKETFKSTHNLTYPVNVARNLARNSSMTHLVLVSDIELYPSVKFIDNFFNMLIRYSRKLDLNRE